ncbi:serine hydrolase domain-containing protein [Pseudoalteromonas phenolica]|uniref:serine hydrolase domain-containing protein n=1 Tax=Pseudoalteromonas phenolica TaxID=161398 RepID=UPI00110B89EA|nr:serine hydrolase domain-containing protein [Pseudoalteromonas phenolica]TMO56645.1 serine hydrolase [Pseudoalteromonas phenolica]
MMRTKILFLLIFFTSFFSLANQIKSKEIDKLLTQYHQLKQFNGVALISHKGKVLLKKGYGKANFEWDINHTVEGKFKIASITKQFTAMLILQLVEKKKLKLDEKLIEYYPSYRADTGSTITIRQLLNHTSGLGNFFHLDGYKAVEARNHYTLDEFISKFCSEDLNFKPGTQFRYSNAGYTILGKVIEQVTGKPYSEVLTEQILNPLNMNNSGFNQQHSVINNRVAGYERLLNRLEHPSFIDMSVPFSAGSIYSTAMDLYRWDRGLAENKILSKPLTKILYQVTEHRNYAAGWLVDNYPEERFGKPLTRVHHGGMIPGFNANISRVLEDDTLVVLLDNTGGAPMTPITEKVLSIIYDKAYEQPELRLSQKLYNMIIEQGTSASIAWYKTLIAHDEGFSERQLIRFAYELVDANEKQAATAFLTLNAVLNPNSKRAQHALKSITSL